MMKLASCFFVALLSICSLTVCHALEAPFPTRELPFAVKDSGVEVPHEYGGPVRWMDNDRVIFSSFKPGAKKYPTGETSQMQIVIWDTTKNSVTVSADGFLQCYSDGRIIYQIDRQFESDGKSSETRRIGEMGKEQEESLQYSPGTFNLHHPYNSYSCNTYSSLGYTTYDEIHRPNPGMRILRLREDHGYLDLYTNTKSSDGLGSAFSMQHYLVKYYRPDRAPIHLGIYRGEIGLNTVFSRYANAYVLDQLISGNGSGSSLLKLPDGQRPSVRLLSPEGEVTTLTYPDALFQITSATEINVSRAGLLIVASAGERFNPRSKTTGLFLARSEKIVKLVNESVNSLDVSPDGCKVVFRQGILNGGWMPIEGHPFTIKIVNVCSSTN